MNESDVSKIIVKYEDGTEKELDKGAVVSFRYDPIDEEDKVIIELIDVKRSDLTMLVYAMIHVGGRLGLLDENE